MFPLLPHVSPSQPNVSMYFMFLPICLSCFPILILYAPCNHEFSFITLHIIMSFPSLPNLLGKSEVPNLFSAKQVRTVRTGELRNSRVPKPFAREATRGRSRDQRRWQPEAPGGPEALSEAFWPKSGLRPSGPGPFKMVQTRTDSAKPRKVGFQVKLVGGRNLEQHVLICGHFRINLQIDVTPHS